jgi:hypothetical protein
MLRVVEGLHSNRALNFTELTDFTLRFLYPYTSVEWTDRSVIQEEGIHFLR